MEALDLEEEEYGDNENTQSNSLSLILQMVKDFKHQRSKKMKSMIMSGAKAIRINSSSICNGW